VMDFKKHDTTADWMYGFSDDDLRGISEGLVEDNEYMSNYLQTYGFKLYDTSVEREQVFDRIINDIKFKHGYDGEGNVLPISH